MTALANRISETPMAPFKALLQSMTLSQKQIVVTFLTESMMDDFEKGVTIASEPDSLAGCWADNAEGEELYRFMRNVREEKSSREINLD